MFLGSRTPRISVSRNKRLHCGPDQRSKLNEDEIAERQRARPPPALSRILPTINPVSAPCKGGIGDPQDQPGARPSKRVKPGRE